MKIHPIILLTLLLLPAELPAQEVNRDTQQLINELKRLTDQAERDRSASYRFIDQLRELSARYDRPWQKQVLFDDFSDGELQRNPSWYSNSNDFWVTRSIGLRSQLKRSRHNQQPAERRSTEEALLGIILEGVIQNNHQQHNNPEPEPVRADLSTSIPISNAFAISMQLSSLGRDSDGSFEWGPYQGQHMESGYRLVYESGNRPALKLLAYRRGLTSVIDQYDRSAVLADGNSHQIEWQRNTQGVMNILVDGRQLMSVRDRTYRDAFSGFVMTNRGGEYGIRSISIFSAQ